MFKFLQNPIKFVASTSWYKAIVKWWRG